MDFMDIYFQENEKILCFRTGLTVYEERFADGRLMAAGYNCAGFTQNVLDSFPTRLSDKAFTEPEAFGLEADGFALNTGWEWENFAQKRYSLENGTEVLEGILTLRSTVKPVAVEVHTVLDGTAVFKRYLTVLNRGETAAAIGHLRPLSGGLETIPGWRDYVPGCESDALYDIGFMRYDTWGKEGAFRFVKLPEAEFAVSGRWLSMRHRHPMFILRNHALGTVFSAQMAWSGGYAFRFHLAAGDDEAKLHFAAELEGPNPQILLQPGEKFDTPAVHMEARFGSLDDAVNGMHDHFRKSVYTLQEPRGMRGGWVEAGMGPERLMDVTATKHFADTAAAVGAETMIIDAGWYCPLGEECQQWWNKAGDWVPNGQRYPGGIEEVRNYIHEKGLLFGLWLDLERIGPDAKVYGAHPDWTIKNADGSNTTVLDMSNPEAAAWAEAEITRVIREYSVDLFRLDYNIDGREPMFYVTHAGQRESAAVRYHRAVYAMYRRLRERFPDVVFENCAGGGGRTDIGHNENFTHTWVSDWQVAPRSAMITGGMTMALPPERVDRLFSGMNSHTRASLDFMVRHTLFARPTTNDYNAVGSQMNPQQIEFVRHSLEIYKNFIRPFAAEGYIYHHTPECAALQPQGDMILERGSKERDRCVIGVFRLSGQPQNAETVIYPRGISPEGMYRVTFDNRGEAAVVSGWTLVHDGIRVRLEGTLTSELICVERV